MSLQFIIVLKRDKTLRRKFFKYADEIGAKIEYPRALKHIVYSDTPIEHEAVKSIEDGSQLISLTGEYQQLAIDSRVPVDTSRDFWHKARVIRRDLPWLTPFARNSLPVETFYEALRDGTGVDVYVIDSGVRTTHEEFGENVFSIGNGTAGGNFDDTGHGTAVAACLVGKKTGIAPGATLFYYKAYHNDVTSGTILANGIDAVIAHVNSRAHLNRPAIVNCSYSGVAASISAHAELIDAGIVLVAAAGNTRVATLLPPGSIADAIAVGGISAIDTPYSTNGSGTVYNTAVAVCAPGQRLVLPGVASDTDYRFWSGTSFSSPITAGVIACMLQGEGRITSRAGVQAVRADLIARSTKNKIQAGVQPSPPNRITYLDPYWAPPARLSLNFAGEGAMGVDIEQAPIALELVFDGGGAVAIDVAEYIPTLEMTFTAGGAFDLSAAITAEFGATFDAGGAFTLDVDVGTALALAFDAGGAMSADVLALPMALEFSAGGDISINAEIIPVVPLEMVYGGGGAMVLNVENEPLVEPVTLQMNYAGAGEMAAALQAVIPTSNLLYWFKADDGVTLVDGKVSEWENHGTGLNAVQSTAARRPVYKSGGLNGKPYLEFDRTQQQFFEDIAFTQPSGITTMRPYTCVVVVQDVDIVSHDGGATVTSAIIFGSPRANGGKAALYFRSPPDAQFHMFKNAARWGNLKPISLAAFSIGRRWDTEQTGVTYFSTRQNKGTVFAGGQGTNPADTNAITAYEFFRSTGITGTAYFDGKIYELLMYDGTISLAQVKEVEDYLWAKYRLGEVPEPVPPAPVNAAYVGSSHGVNSDYGNITINAPAGVQAGDFMVMAVLGDTISPAFINGDWTHQINNGEYSIYTKTAGAGEASATYTVQLSDISPDNKTNIAGIVAYRPATGVTYTASSVVLNSSATIPAQVATKAGAIMVCGAGNTFSGVPSTPIGFDRHVDVATGLRGLWMFGTVLGAMGTYGGETLSSGNSAFSLIFNPD